MEEVKDECAGQVLELETQLDKMKEQLTHLNFLSEKEKQENEIKNADNFVSQMN
jgi:uncharacterized protein with PhoU and TrkA domain